MIRDILKFNSIRKRIIISFSILIIIILLFQVITSYYITYKTVSGINKSYITAGLRQKSVKLDDFFKDIDLFSKTLISNNDIQNLMLQNKDVSFGVGKIWNEAAYGLTNTIDGIFLISDKGRVYQEADTGLGQYVNDNLAYIKKSISSSKGEMVFLNGKFISYGSLKHGDYFFLIARKIRSINTFKDIGLMVFAIREEEMWHNISMDGDVGDFYLADVNGYIISCRNKELIGTNIYKKLDRIIQGRTSFTNNVSYVKNGQVINIFPNRTSGWNLLNIVPTSEFNANYVKLQRIILVIGIIAIIIAIYISIIISRRITYPIRDLIQSMKSVAAGNLDVRSDTDLLKGSTDELLELNNVFNHMTKKLQYLIQQVYDKNLREKDTELKALKAQINPHFLYNTLDTIYWMLIENSDYEIADLVTRLGEILRYSIKKGSRNVTIREELQQVENYLFIQKARFEENLEYDLDIDETLLPYVMQSFLLQPFVENSINHGIMNSKGKGRVGVKGYIKEKTVIFEITDDGEGMTAEQVLDLFENKDKKPNNRIGIENVNERIKYYYGEKYGVSIESQKDSGTKVTIEIPLMELEGSDNEAKNTLG